MTHSDATLIIAREPWNENESEECSNSTEELTGGTRRTADYCKKHGKPYLVIFAASVPKVIDWLTGLAVPDLVLNVAGPRESKAKGIQEATRKFVTRLMETLKKENKHADDWRSEEALPDGRRDDGLKIHKSGLT